ncbi:MAG: NADH-quinone oxidoreductase subunit L [Candidatus Eisenbacteria bacterium]|nr:NADH-quinone oxidoreductase subunit L [Candidatus Eisenbacteria bacterium]
MEYFWLIPFLPLAGFLITGLFQKWLNEKSAGLIASAAVGAAFVLAVISFFGLLSLPADQRVVHHTISSWIEAGRFNAPLAFLLDPLSMVMVLVITGVGFLIHVYSIGYMHGDSGVKRFFSYLNLFTFAMLVLVLADNLLLLFVGWEGVGLCSYLLIGYWYEKKSATDAGKKAFIVNRIGDFGFLLATALVFWTLGTVNFREIAERAPGLLEVGGGMITAITLLFFLGATGKSAQLPLYTWLPDAMEGPTPVSALIHAATMVTAGVYLLARTQLLYTMAPLTMFVVLVIGMATAIFAGSIGLAQTDIKKVLAYSTVSQLGFMFAACGVGAFAAAIFHLVTHAFFKALLFLGSGSVIHGLHGEQEMPKMGGLKDKMPTTFRVFLIGGLALSGVPIFAGFFSKDEILWEVFASGNVIPWVVLAIAALFTAFYTTRAIILTFYGQPRDRHLYDHAHESPAVMTVPLVILAVLSTIGGLLGIPLLAGGQRLKAWLSPVLGGGHAAAPAAHGAAEVATHAAEVATRSAAPHASTFHYPGLLSPFGHDTTLEMILIVVSVAIALIGIFLATRLYAGDASAAEKLRLSWGGLHRLLANKYFVDELYNAIVVRPIKLLSDFFWQIVDVRGIDGAVNGVGTFLRGTGDELRRWQTGLAQNYAVAIVFGTLLILAFVLWGRWAL